MEEMMMWRWWYRMLLVLPLLAAEVLVKDRMMRTVAYSREFSSINPKQEVGHVIFQDR
jgi:hypothetical protein